HAAARRLVAAAADGGARPRARLDRPGGRRGDGPAPAARVEGGGRRGTPARGPGRVVGGDRRLAPPDRPVRGAGGARRGTRRRRGGDGRLFRYQVRRRAVRGGPGARPPAG